MIDIEITFDWTDANNKLTESETRLGNNTAFQENLAAFLYNVTMTNFDTQGRGKWEPLSARRISERGNSEPILQDTGTLKNSILPFSDNNEAEVSTGISYAALNQYGGINEEGRFVPARPFFELVESDTRHIESMAEGYFFSPFAQ